MWIVGNWRTIGVLSCGLAMAAALPVHAQTVTVGGDWRPQIEVDSRVLNALGPEPTLPDMLLGRRPMPAPTGPVQLHRPHHGAGAAVALKRPAEAKPAEAQRKTATAQPQPQVKLAKPAKMAEAAPARPAKSAATQEKRAAAQEKPSKNQVASLEAPPPPPTRYTPSPANADMPALSSSELPTAPATEHKVTTPPPAKAVTSQPIPAPAAPAPASTTPPKTASTTPPAQPAPASAPQTLTPAAPAPAAAANDTESGTTKQALLTPPPPAAAAAPNPASLSIGFAPDGAELGDDAKRSLSDVAKRSEADASVELLILAYSSGDDASKARRLSLSRALVVRSFLKDQGVPSARIEVRALGNKVPDGLPDRVDLVEQKH